MSPSRIKLITLDLDDTLWPCAEVIQAAEMAVLAWLGERVPQFLDVHDRSSLRDHRLGLMRERPEIAHDLGEVRRLSMALVLVDQGLEVDAAHRLADQAMGVFLVHRHQVAPYADVEPVLRRLAERYRLISITNGNADPERTPLAGVFHHCITAGAAGVAKPDPSIFQLALSLGDCTPVQCLHVGDEPHLDVHAARCMGIGAIWVNRCGRAWPEELQPPDLEVRDLRQLADWLGQQGAPKRQPGVAADGI